MNTVELTDEMLNEMSLTGINLGINLSTSLQPNLDLWK
jgi:hypothetical protein